jgi:hypothetical protein
VLPFVRMGADAACEWAAMLLRLGLVFVLGLAWSVGALAQRDSVAQKKVRTESIRPPAGPPEIVTDIARLPPLVASARQRILEAARSGDLQKLVTVMKSNEPMPSFSPNDEKDPIAYWKTNYPDSDGIEVLAILIEILEAGYLHVDRGTPQEMYLWPYFARTPLNTLTPAQKVDLLKIVTGSDYKDMVDLGHYIFYRLGIGPDGTWHFFVAGD